jgi:hypothetical protein
MPLLFDVFGLVTAISNIKVIRVRFSRQRFYAELKLVRMSIMGNTMSFSRMSLGQWVGATVWVGAAVMGVANTAMAQATQDTPENALMAQTEIAQEIAQTEVAQDVPRQRRAPEVRPLPTIPEAFNRAYYRNDGNFFDNRGIWQGFRLIFGIPSYVENAISEDGRRVDRLYKEVLEQQVSSDPVLRTPDLPNPYTGSILTTPLVISEEPIAPLPPFPAIRRRAAEPAPVAPEAEAQREPVPALW